MTDSGGIIEIAECPNIGYDQQCSITDNGEWQTMMNDRQWQMAENGEWQTMRNNRQW